jgi:hypothetical protein
MAEKPATDNLTEGNLEPEDGEETDQAEIQDEIENEVENTPTESKKTSAEITYENATILIAITLLPETDNDSLERQIMISASNLGGVPVSKLVHLSDISPLPAAIAEIIDALKIELPKREAQRKLKQSQAKFKNKSAGTTGNQTKTSADNPSNKKSHGVKQLSFFK